MLARAAYFYLQSLGTWRFSRERLKALQRRKLSRTVREAYKKLPIYQGSFRDSGISADSLQRVQDVKDLPFLTKSQIIASYPLGIRRRDIPIAMTRTGSGTTGVRNEMAWGQEQLDLNQALLARRLTMAGVRPWTRVGSLWPPASNWRSESIGAKAARPMTTALWNSSFSNIIRNMPNFRTFPISYRVTEREAAGIGRFSPVYLQGNPSYLRRVGEALGEYGLSVRLQALICVNEPFTEAAREELGQIFACGVLNAIGSTELGVIGSECQYQNGIHLNEDFILCEVLRGDEPVSPGEVGELVLTSLHNPVMPLLRYRTGDLVELKSTSTCPCGSSLMRITRVLGRADEGLVLATGRRMTPMEVAEEIERKTKIRDYQLVQGGLHHFVLRLPPGVVESSGDLDSVKAILESHLGQGVTLETELRNESELWKKNRPILSKVIPT